MFQYNEKLKRLDIPAKNVLRLQRSLGDVQIALPGIKAQRAAAYVCAFSVEQGLRVTIAFHLRETNAIVFYLNDGNKSREEIGAVLSEGIRFAETLGFILTDLDIQKSAPEDRESIWESLPLKNPPQPVEAKKVVTAKAVTEEKKPSSEPRDQKAVKVEAVVNVEKGVAPAGDIEEIDLGLPRTATLASIRRKKAPPTAEELEEMRSRLRESLGRFLSSM